MMAAIGQTKDLHIIGGKFRIGHTLGKGNTSLVKGMLVEIRISPEMAQYKQTC